MIPIIKQRCLFLALWAISVIGVLFAIVKMLLSVFSKNPRTLIYAIAADQFVNVSIGGYPDETISSRAYRGALAGKFWWSLLRNALDWIDTDHCKKSYESELMRAHMCPELRGNDERV